MKTATQCLLTYLQRVLVLLLLVFSSVHALADPPVAQDDSLSIQEDQVVIVEVLANDSDPDGDPLSITIISQSAFGTSVVLNGDSIEYTPDLDFFGNDTVVYRVCDGNGECDTAQLVITVTGENDFPIAMDDFALTSEDVVITFNVLGNDEEPDGEAVTVSIVSGPANGFAAIVLDSIVYTPALNFSGSDTVFYAICDTSLLCDTAMLVINITTTNDAPLALNDTASTTEDSAIVADVQANDSDPDGDPLTTTVIVPPSLAAATVMNGDSISYMPDLNATGNDSLAYRVCDGNGGCDTAWLYVTISAVNDAPLGTADNAATAEETTVVIDVQANDSDPENDVMTTTVSGLPSNGAAAVLNGDSLQYTPDADFFGFDTLQYAVCDPAMLCDTVEVIIAVTNVQDAPVAVTDSITTVEDSVVIIDVQANDSDADGDILFTSIITPPTSGTAVVIAGDSVLYTSLATGAGLDSFQYEVCDGSSLCAQAWVYINITGVNDAPIAIDDFTLTPEDSAIVVDVQANDLDPDGDTLTTTIVAGPSNGLAVVLNGNSIQYTPDTAFQGFDTIIYSVCDTGGLCDTAMLVIRVNDLDLSPIANNDNAVVLEDSSVVIDVQANDFDPVGLMMVTAVTGAPSNGTATVINLDSILYTPDPDFVGTDTFFYSACNPICDTARVIVTVLQVNDPPVAMNDTVTTGENIAITIDVQANDSDIEGNTLTTTVVVQPGMGVATVLNGDSLGYVPNTNINGDDSLQYRVCDGNGGCDSAWVYINISAVNNAPVAQADFGFTDEETALTIDVQLNDLDPDGDTLLTTVITAPVNGAASVLGSDSISYTPDVDFFGFDTLTYSVCDTGGLCDTATVVIEVGGLNDAPIALTDSATTDEEVTIVIDIQANDTDADGNTLVTNIITPAANGMATVVNGDSISYTPGLNFYGWDSLTYEVCDGNGGCGQASVYINVLLLADAPVAGDDFYTLDEDSVMLLDVQANDFDADSDSIVTTAIVTLPLNGTTLIVNGDSITYTPDSNYNGTDSFAYSLCDTTGLCDTAMVFLTITAINDAPLAVDDSATTPEDIAVNVDVQLNDSDADGDPFTTVVVAAAANGTAQVVGGVSITYTPDTGYSGTDSVGYEICDGSGACAQATLYITILSVNDPPVAAGDSATTMEEVAVTIDVQANDTDPENDSLITTAIVSAPANGSATILGGDSISYDPDVDFFGTDVFTYAVCDTGGLCDTAIVVVTVLNIDDTLLVAVDDSVTAQE